MDRNNEGEKGIKNKIVMFNPKPSLTMHFDGPPMAIMSAVSLLDETKEYEIKIIDWHYEDYEERIKKECKDAMIFGVTCLTGYQIKGMIDSARIAKEVNPKIKVVCGGWHSTFMPEQTLQCKDVDYVVIGQGPRVFRELVEKIKNNKKPVKINGIAYREKENIIINPPLHPEPLSNFPEIPYHLLEDNEYFIVGTKFGKRVAYILTSQGCPSNCAFCSESAFYKRRWTNIPIPRVMKTIDFFIKNYNIDGVMPSDSNFFVDEKRVAEFCRGMIKRKLKWGGVAARPDSLARYSEKTWKLMKDSGLDGIFIGTESADNETLKIMNKGCRIEDTLKTIEMAKRYNLQIQIPFIIGVPGVDVEQDFKSDMKFIKEHMNENLQFHMFVFTPYPGTYLMQKAIEMGYKPPEKLEGWIDYTLHEGVTPWVDKKYAKITDQLSIYFQFLAGNTEKVIKTIVRFPINIPALAANKIIYELSRFRVRNSFFYFPLEYNIIKFILRNRRLFFKGKNIVY